MGRLPSKSGALVAPRGPLRGPAMGSERREGRSSLVFVIITTSSKHCPHIALPEVDLWPSVGQSVRFPPNASPGSPPAQCGRQLQSWPQMANPRDVLTRTLPSRSPAVRTGLAPSVPAPPRVVCRSRSMKNGGFVGCQNSTFSRGPKSTESDEVRVLYHRGVIEGRSRGTIVLTTHLSGVVLRRSPTALSIVSLGYKTSKATNTGQEQCLYMCKERCSWPV